MCPPHLTPTPAGKPVNTLYVAKKMKLAREMYFAILLDRASAGGCFARDRARAWLRRLTLPCSVWWAATLRCTCKRCGALLAGECR